MFQSLVPLDHPELKHRYTPEQVENGNVAVGDCGLIYGYGYQPERFNGTPDSGVVGTTSLYPYSHSQQGYMPLCNTIEEAIQVLQKNNWYGHVLRYCKDRKYHTPGSTSVFYLGSTKYENPYRPWITAGVIALVNVPKPANGEKISMHVSILSLKAGMIVVFTDGTRKVISRNLVDMDWTKLNNLGS